MNLNFASYFSNIIVDNNGNTCSDINAGLQALFSEFAQQRPYLSSIQKYFVAEFEEGYSDLVALNSMLGESQLWWWILLACRYDDALKYPEKNTILPIFEPIDLSLKTAESLAESSATLDEKDTNVNIVVELN